MDGLGRGPVSVARELSVLDEGALLDERLEGGSIGEVVGDSGLLAGARGSGSVCTTEKKKSAAVVWSKDRVEEVRGGEQRENVG